VVGIVVTVAAGLPSRIEETAGKETSEDKDGNVSDCGMKRLRTDETEG